MECNKDEALKAKELAEKKFVEKDIIGARKGKELHQQGEIQVRL